MPTSPTLYIPHQLTVIDRTDAGAGAGAGAGDLFRHLVCAKVGQDCQQHTDKWREDQGQHKPSDAPAPAPACGSADDGREQILVAVVQRKLMILRRAVFDAGVRTAALGRFALRHRIVGAFLTRSGFKAEAMVDVVTRRLRKGTFTRNRTCGEDGCYHDGAHRILHCFPPWLP
jgi:hypothetical protein